MALKHAGKFSEASVKMKLLARVDNAKWLFKNVFGGAINAGISIGGMYAATGLASLAMGAMTAASIPGGIVVVGGAVIAILAGVGLNYLFTEVNFFGNTIECHLNDFVDWLIFWD